MKPYDNPFWDFNNGGEERGYIARRVRLYCRKSAVIFPEERGYMAGGVRLYGEERGYMMGH